ncbi:hypothetical protein JOF53_000734 [Crossiella equi]|uniref:Uncharacterized protein n=1 Tax=Crossiella equi TaxID=130796 RepID=A0ABS5A5I2_9PSEU|nr:hypothetical protein [Crossiella equi]MBP2471862.1 hypothetical protein [Crossiella equi]
MSVPALETTSRCVTATAWAARALPPRPPGAAVLVLDGVLNPLGEDTALALLHRLPAWLGGTGHAELEVLLGPGLGTADRWVPTPGRIRVLFAAAGLRVLAETSGPRGHRFRLAAGVRR